MDGHEPVMVGEVMAWLAPAPGGRVVDGTVGLGGHAERLAGAVGPGGALLAIDRDPEALALARRRLAGAPCRVRFARGRFERMASWLERLGWGGADAVLLDLGVSSLQLDRPERGFSFRRDGPLDMRMDPTRGPTAADLVRDWSEEALADAFRRLGDERRPRRLARIVAEARRGRPITTTARLAELLSAGRPAGGRVHPATRAFQALRMAVNDELGALERGLAAAAEALRGGGRLAVLAFHSGEDRLVKRAFLAWEAEARGQRLHRKAIRPGRAECLANRRARSAVLRVFGFRGTPCAPSRSSPWPR